jgi:hypothetical protein
MPSILWLAAAAAVGAFWPNVTRLYFPEGSAQMIYPVLPKPGPAVAQANGEAGQIDRYCLVLEMPAAFEVVDCGRSRDFAVMPAPLAVPTSVQQEQFESEGQCWRRYRMEFAPEAVTGAPEAVRAAVLVRASAEPGTGDPAGRPYASTPGGAARVGAYGHTPLRHRGPPEARSRSAEAMAGEQFAFEMSAEADGAELPGSRESVAVEMLPALRGQRPAGLTTAVCCYLDYESEALRQAALENALAAGFNLIIVMGNWSAESALVSGFRAAGGKAIFRLNEGDFAAGYLETHPEAQALGPGGKPLPNRVCRSALAEPDEALRQALRAYLASLAPARYDGVLVDLEESAEALCFCARCRNDFWQRLGQAGPPPSGEEILKRYGEQWVNFRCWQSSGIAETERSELAVASPQALSLVYSGPQRTGDLAGYTMRHYSVDWRRMASACDLASTGYAPRYGDAAMTTSAIGGIPYVPGVMYRENFNVWEGRNPDPRRWAVWLLGEFLDGGGRGGLMIWYWQMLDGGGLWGASEAAAVLARFEEFFLKGARADYLLEAPATADPGQFALFLLGDQALLVALSTEEEPVEWVVGVPYRVHAIEASEGGTAELTEGGVRLSIPPLGYCAVTLSLEAR